MQEASTLPAHTPQTTAAADRLNWHEPDIDVRGRGTAVERHIVLLAVLPAALVAVTGAAAGALLFAVGADRVGGSAFWILLTGTLLIVLGILTSAALLAVTKARALGRRHAEVSTLAARGHAELAQLRWQFDRSKDLLERRRNQGAPLSEQAEDALDRLGDKITSAQQAVATAARESAVESGTRVAAGVARTREPAAPTPDERHFEVFANMARRLESLVHREIGLLDDLENEVENPDLLKGLFRVDHLATRIRRYAENLAVLGGAVSHRMWTQPVSMSDVMRSAAAEVESYARVKMVPPVEGTVKGHAVVDVVHLLAELVENATVFSPPHTQVLLRAEHVPAGLAIEVEDRGLGMTSAERKQMNSLLTSPDEVALGELLRDGRIGLYVVSALARRHGIAVQLQNNVYGGTQAVAVLPPELLGGHTEMARPEPQPEGDAPDPAEQEPARETAAPTRTAPRPPTKATATATATANVTATDTTRDGQTSRPSLPQRRRQENLAPELRDAARLDAARTQASAEAETDAGDAAGHDPGLMAAFQRGVRRAEEPGETEETGEGRGPGEPAGAEEPGEPTGTEEPGEPTATAPVGASAQSDSTP